MLFYDVVFLEKVSVPKKQWTWFTELFSLSVASFFSFLNLVGKLAHWAHFLFFILLYTSKLPIYKKCQYKRYSELGLFNSFHFHSLFFFFFSFSNLVDKLSYWTSFLFFIILYTYELLKKKILTQKIDKYFHNCWGVNCL